MTARKDGSKPRGRTHLTDFDRRVLAALIDHVGSAGISTTALHGTFFDRKSIAHHRVRNSLDGLEAMGLCEKYRRIGGVGTIWTLPGQDMPDGRIGYLADRVCGIESDKNAKALRSLFFTAQARYEDDPRSVRHDGYLRDRPIVYIAQRVAWAWS